MHFYQYLYSYSEFSIVNIIILHVALENLYDVFINIRDDEGEHCKTMKACQTHGNLQSPHSNPDYLGNDSSSEGIVDCIVKSINSSKPQATDDLVILKQLSYSDT